jgi:uncharacterized protein involved in exopolysaccharide biosynthesis
MYLQSTLESRREAALEARRSRAERAAPTPNGQPDSETESSPSGPSPEDVRDELTLRTLLTRYGEQHPDVQRLKREIEDRREIRRQLMEAAAAAQAAEKQRAGETPAESATVTGEPVEEATGEPSFPEIQSQLDSLEQEVARNKRQQDEILQAISRQQARIEAVPVREQEITDLVRDYEISRQHYQALLAKKLAADTGTDLEIRQKGERFTILDPAQVPERPSGPDRIKINVAGSGIGLILGLLLAFLPELVGSSITLAEQVTTYAGVPVLGVIPTIRTRIDRERRRRWVIAGAASGVATVLLGCSLLVYHFRDRIF